MDLPIGVPTVSRAQGALATFGIGALGGFLSSLSEAIIGTSIIGNAVSAVVAGSTIKGEAGKTLALVAGYDATRSLSNPSAGGGKVKTGADNPASVRGSM